MKCNEPNKMTTKRREKGGRERKERGDRKRKIPQKCAYMMPIHICTYNDSKADHTYHYTNLNYITIVFTVVCTVLIWHWEVHPPTVFIHLKLDIRL